jgi:hypothetical protein
MICIVCCVTGNKTAWNNNQEDYKSSAYLAISNASNLQAAKGRRKAVITLIEHRHHHPNILQ